MFDRIKKLGKNNQPQQPRDRQDRLALPQSNSHDLARNAGVRITPSIAQQGTPIVPSTIYQPQSPAQIGQMLHDQTVNSVHANAIHLAGALHVNSQETFDVFSGVFTKVTSDLITQMREEIGLQPEQDQFVPEDLQKLATELYAYYYEIYQKVQSNFSGQNGQVAIPNTEQQLQELLHRAQIDPQHFSDFKAKIGAFNPNKGIIPHEDIKIRESTFLINYIGEYAQFLGVAAFLGECLIATADGVLPFSSLLMNLTKFAVSMGAAGFVTTKYIAPHLSAGINHDIDTVHPRHKLRNPNTTRKNMSIAGRTISMVFLSAAIGAFWPNKAGYMNGLEQDVVQATMQDTASVRDFFEKDPVRGQNVRDMFRLGEETMRLEKQKILNEDRMRQLGKIRPKNGEEPNPNSPNYNEQKAANDEYSQLHVRTYGQNDQSTDAGARSRKDSIEGKLQVDRAEVERLSREIQAAYPQIGQKTLEVFKDIGSMSKKEFVEKYADQYLGVSIDDINRKLNNPIFEMTAQEKIKANLGDIKANGLSSQPFSSGLITLVAAILFEGAFSLMTLNYIRRTKGINNNLELQDSAKKTAGFVYDAVSKLTNMLMVSGMFGNNRDFATSFNTWVQSPHIKQFVQLHTIYGKSAVVNKAVDLERLKQRDEEGPNGAIIDYIAQINSKVMTARKPQEMVASFILFNKYTSMLLDTKNGIGSVAHTLPQHQRDFVFQINTIRNSHAMLGQLNPRDQQQAVQITNGYNQFRQNLHQLMQWYSQQASNNHNQTQNLM